MTGENALEHRYRRLLAWYPAAHRRTYAEEMIGVLMAAAPEGSSRPGLAGAVDLIRGGLKARFRSGLRWLAGTDWPDALAVCSVAVPVILAGFFTADWLYSLGTGLLHGYAGPWYGQAERGLIVLAIAAPPLLALRWRRTAVVVALALGSPAGQPTVRADRVGQLVALQVGGCQARPPVAAGSGGGVTAEVAGEVAAGRVDDADGYAAPGLLDGEPQVAVVGDDQRGVDLAAEDVHPEVGGDVDVGAFLLAVGVRHHEHRAVHGAPGAVLDHDRPGRADEAGPTVRIIDGQRRGLHP